jgi:outer membrane protein
MKSQNRLSKVIVTALAVVFLFAPVLEAKEYTLHDLYEAAMKTSEKIKISGENVYLAEIGKDKALSVVLPRISGLTGYQRYTEDKRSDSGLVIQPLKSSAWALRLDETLSVSGREFTSIGISKDDIERSRYDYQSVREDYLLSLSTAYFDLLKARKGVEIADSNVERLTKYRDAARTRLKAGELTKTFLLRAEGELSGALSDQIRAKNFLELARVILSRVSGIEKEFDIKEIPIEDTEMASLEQLQESALVRRPEIRSLDRQRKIAEKQIDVAKGTYYPTVSIAGVYSGADQDPITPFFIRESVFGSITLNIPFYEGGLRRAEVKESESRQRQMELLYQDVVKSIRVEVQNAYLDYLTQKGVLRFAQDQLVFAEDNIRAIAKQFEFGLASSLDVIDANNLLISAQRQMAEATYNFQLSILKVKRATGIYLMASSDQKERSYENKDK